MSEPSFAAHKLYVKHVKPAIVDYAFDVVKKYGMDDSHGIPHFLRVVGYIDAVYDKIKSPTRIQIAGWNDEYLVRETIYTAGYVHDLIDDKYIKGKKAQREALVGLQNALRNCGYTEEQVEAISFIINNMSWSKRHKRKMQVEPKIPQIKENQYTIATQLVSDADMLDAFDPERCREYTMHKYKTTNRNDENVCNWVRTIMGERVLRYISDYMTFDECKVIAKPLHDELVEYIKVNLADAKPQPYMELLVNDPPESC